MARRGSGYLRHGKPSEITVQLGLDDGAYTEIIAGDVQSGDELIIGESGGLLEAGGNCSS